MGSRENRRNGEMECGYRWWLEKNWRGKENRLIDLNTAYLIMIKIVKKQLIMQKVKRTVS